MEEIKKLVLESHSAGEFLKCYHEDGSVFKPTASRFKPVAGTDHYAHVQLTQQSANQYGHSSRYEVKGPDWSATVNIFQGTNGTIDMNFNLNNITAAETFLSNFV